MSNKFPYVHPLLGVPCRLVSYGDAESMSAQIEEPTMANEEQTGPEGIKHAFNLLIAAERQRYPRLTRLQAVARVVRKEPGMHRLYLEACNPKTAFPKFQ